MTWHNALQTLAIKYLEHVEEKLHRQGVSYGQNGCGRHSGHEVEHQDLCPCEARIYYYFDRIEESYHRFHRAHDRFGFWKWLLWYIRSSRWYFEPDNGELLLTETLARNPLFPRKSFNAYYQHHIGLEPWIRYKIGKLDDHGYSYHPGGGHRSKTPRVGRKKK